MKFRIPILDDKSVVHRFYKELMVTLQSKSRIEIFTSEHKTWKLGIEQQMMILLVWRGIILLIILVSADKLSEMIKNLVIT